MKRILLLMGIVPILMSLASCGKKENVTVEETTEAWEEMSYLELDKTFTGEEFIGTYDTGCMGAGGGYGKGEVPPYYTLGNGRRCMRIKICQQLRQRCITLPDFSMITRRTSMHIIKDAITKLGRRG